MLDGVDRFVKDVVLPFPSPLFRLERLGEKLVRRAKSTSFAELKSAQLRRLIAHRSMPHQNVVVVITVRSPALWLRVEFVHVDIVNLGLALALRFVFATLRRVRLRLPLRLLR